MTDAERTIVITGASRGIGRVAARRMLTEQPRSHLVLLTRNAPHDLLSEFAAVGGTVSTIHTELSSLQSVADATDEVVARARSGALPPIHGLVCNAGVQHANALTETIDGFESTFAVNVLANHVLVRRLQDHLHSHARLVITVSDTHFGDFRHNLGMVPGPVWQPVATLARTGAFPEPAGTTAGRTAYSTSKLATIYLVHEYARRLPATWRIAGYNPGFVPGTALARHADAFSQFAMRRIMPLLTVTPLAASVNDAGQFLADTVLGTLEAPRGGYVDRRRIARSSEASYDPQRERETWEAVEALTAGFLPTTAEGDIYAHHRDHRGE